MTKEKMLRVKDTSCTQEYPVRTHTIALRGQKIDVVFKFGEEKILPFEQGLKFQLPGFIVEEIDGTQLVLPAVTKDNIVGSLAKDEVVAKVVELTTSSLKVRAARKVGGEIFLNADESARADIIAFLIGKPPAGLATDETKAATVDGEENLIADDDDGEGNPDSTLGKPGNPTFPPVVPAPVTPVVAAATPAPAEQAAPPRMSDPDAASLAIEYGLDLSPYFGQGSGKDGLILKADVQYVIDTQKLQPLKKAG